MYKKRFGKVFDNVEDSSVQEAIKKYGDECEPGTEFLVKPNTVCRKCQDGRISFSDLRKPKRRGDFVRVRG